MKPSEATWYKASRSTENGGNCVELTATNSLITIRDSKDPRGPVVTMKRNDFRHFTEMFKNSRPD